MIVRVLGQGQWVLEPKQLVALNTLDQAVEKAVAEDDQAALEAALAELVAGVREQGTPVPDEVIAESDLVLPDVDATVAEVRALFEKTSEYYGLIPDSEPAQAAAPADAGEVSTEDLGEDYGDGAPTYAPVDAGPEWDAADNPADKS